MREEHARALFLLAGIDIRRMHELLNGYWRENATKGPWWLAETPYGTIRIGWRKRVIEIEWEGTRVRKIITGDDVTKSPTLAHAWSWIKALEYLTVLSRELSLELAGGPALSENV